MTWLHNVIRLVINAVFPMPYPTHYIQILHFLNEIPLQVNTNLAKAGALPKVSVPSVPDDIPYLHGTIGINAGIKTYMVHIVPP